MKPKNLNQDTLNYEKLLTLAQKERPDLSCLKQDKDEKWRDELFSMITKALNIHVLQQHQTDWSRQTISGTYSHKTDLLLSLQYIYLYLKETPKDQHHTVARILFDGLPHCTPGFHNRVNDILNHIFSARDSIEGLLHCIRNAIVERAARELDDEVHTYRTFFNEAYALGYHVLPVNSNDPHAGNLSEKTIHQSLNTHFSQYYSLITIYAQLFLQIKEQAVERGYRGCIISEDGKQELGYVIGVFSYLDSFFKPKEVTEYLLMSQSSINGYEYVCDIHWMRIKELLWERLTKEHYFFLSEEAQQTVLTLISNQAASTEDVTRFMRLNLLHHGVELAHFILLLDQHDVHFLISLIRAYLNQVPDKKQRIHDLCHVFSFCSDHKELIKQLNHTGLVSEYLNPLELEEKHELIQTKSIRMWRFLLNSITTITHPETRQKALSEFHSEQHNLLIQAIDHQPEALSLIKQVLTPDEFWKALTWKHNNFDMTPIGYAVFKKRWGFVQEITSSLQTDKQDRIGLAQALLYAAYYNHADTIHALIASGALDAHCCYCLTDTGLNAIHYLIHHNQVRFIKLLMHSKKPFVERALASQDKEGNTPVVYAAKKGHWDCVQEIIMHAKAEKTDKKDLFKALCLAAEHTDPKAQSLFFNCTLNPSGIPWHYSDSKETIIHIAIRKKNKTLLKKIMREAPPEAIVHLLSWTDIHNKTPILAAAEEGLWDTVREIANRRETDDTDAFKYADALLLALQNNEITGIRALLGAGALKNKRAWTPLHSGQNIIHWLIEHEILNLFILLMSHAPIQLLEHALTHKNKNKETPLEYAHNKRQFDFIWALFERLYDEEAMVHQMIESKDTKPLNVLMHYISKKEVQNVLGNKNPEGDTPLSLAFKQKKLDFIYTLLNIKQEEKAFIKALIHAQKSPHTEQLTNNIILMLSKQLEGQHDEASDIMQQVQHETSQNNGYASFIAHTFMGKSLRKKIAADAIRFFNERIRSPDQTTETYVYR